MGIAVFILAGGAGLRLWPLSSKTSPKQFLPLLPDNCSFFEKTLSRAKKLCNKDNIYILTVEQYKDRIYTLAPDIPPENIITESEKRNTAPGLAVAMMKIHHNLGDTTAVVMPSDHYIENEDIFIKTVLDAAECAEKTDGIVTIGISPSEPAVNYGYIKLGSIINTSPLIFATKGFTEKPDIKTAEAFLADGNYLWNSGIFIWKTSAVLREFEKHLPEVSALAKQMLFSAKDKVVQQELYSQMPNISIDYGILEKSDCVFTVPGYFLWDDIGSWESFIRLCKTDKNGNSSFGSCINIDSKNCLSVSCNSTVITFGTDNLCVIDTGNRIIIFPKDRLNEPNDIYSIFGNQLTE